MIFVFSKKGIKEVDVSSLWTAHQTPSLDISFTAPEQLLYNAAQSNFKMASKKIFVVFGATGSQGGSVVKALLKDPKTAALYKVRAITRDATKPAAIALTSLGAEVVTVSNSHSFFDPFIH